MDALAKRVRPRSTIYVDARAQPAPATGVYEDKDDKSQCQGSDEEGLICGIHPPVCLDTLNLSSEFTFCHCNEMRNN